MTLIEHNIHIPLTRNTNKDTFHTLVIATPSTDNSFAARAETSLTEEKKGGFAGHIFLFKILFRES